MNIKPLTVHVALATVLIAGCGGNVSPDTPKPPPASQPENAPAKRQAPIVLSPDATSEHIRALKHAPTGEAITDAPRIPRGAVVIPVGKPTILEDLTNGFGGDCWFGSGWELNYGDGPIEDLLVKWATSDKSGQVSITIPVTAQGISLMVSGCEPGTEKWARRMIVGGNPGLENLVRVNNEYVPLRNRDKEIPADFPVEDPVASVETRPLMILNTDVDADGTTEVVVYSFRSWLDDEGVQLAQAGEIGILWDDPATAPSFGNFGLSQGTAFPFFHVVSPKLNGGSPLFYGVHRCCGGTTIRTLTLKDGVFGKETFQTAEGDKKIVLHPSTEGPAKIVIE